MTKKNGLRRIETINIAKAITIFWLSLTTQREISTLPCFFTARVIVQSVINIAELSKAKSVPLCC